ncbi:MAG: hypothetical protein ACRCYU_17500, partial [Nocardioides sp.]
PSIFDGLFEPANAKGSLLAGFGLLASLLMLGNLVLLHRIIEWFENLVRRQGASYDADMAWLVAVVAEAHLGYLVYALVAPRFGLATRWQPRVVLWSGILQVAGLAPGIVSNSWSPVAVTLAVTFATAHLRAVDHTNRECG